MPSSSCSSGVGSSDFSSSSTVDSDEEQRRQHLLEMACTACETFWPHLGLDLSTLSVLSLSTNAIYKVHGRARAESSSESSCVYVLRLLDSTVVHAVDDTALECLWLESLHKEYHESGGSEGGGMGVQVPCPVRTVNDQLFGQCAGPLNTVTAEGDIDYHADAEDEDTSPTTVNLFQYIPGERLGDDRVTVETARLWGQLSARLHRHAAQNFRLGHDDDAMEYTISCTDGTTTTTNSAKMRSYCYNHTFASRQTTVITRTDGGGVFPIGETRAALYRKFAAVVDAEIASIWKQNRENGVEPVPLHLDLHPDNVLIVPGSASSAEADSKDGLSNSLQQQQQHAAIDFEDVIYGYPIQDLAISLYHIHDRRNGKELMQSFRDGYEQVVRLGSNGNGDETAGWPEIWPRQLELLILGRKLMMVDFMVHTWRDQKRIQREMNKVDKLIEAYFAASSNEAKAGPTISKSE